MSWAGIQLRTTVFQGLGLKSYTCLGQELNSRLLPFSAHLLNSAAFYRPPVAKTPQLFTSAALSRPSGQNTVL